MYNLQSTTGNLLLPWSIRSSYSMLPCLHGRRWDLLWEDEAAATQGEIHGLMRGPSYQNGLQWCFWGSLSERSAKADASNSQGTVEYSWAGMWQAALVPLFAQDKKVRWHVMCIKLTSCVSSHGFDNYTSNILAEFMGLVTLGMFCTNCLREAHGYAIDRFCGFMGSCFVPIACYGWAQLPTTRDMGGCVRVERGSIVGFLLSFSSRWNWSPQEEGTELWQSCYTFMLLVVGDGMTVSVIAEEFLRLRPVTIPSVLGIPRSGLRTVMPPQDDACSSA